MDGKRKAERQPRPEEDIKTTRDLPDEPDLSQGWVLIIIQNTVISKLCSVESVQLLLLRPVMRSFRRPPTLAVAD